MSTILSVDFPKQVSFGKPFPITVKYAAAPGETLVNVTALNHLDVQPPSITVDPTQGSQGANLTIQAPAGGAPAGGLLVLVRFSFGASEWTSGAIAS